MLPRLILLIIFFNLVNNGNCTTYYFSTSTGLDSRSIQQAQNPLTPWQSLNKLNLIAHTFKPGDSILFKSDDTFFGSLKLFRSGTPKAKIFFGSYNNGKKPLLTGFLEIDSWISKSANLFEAHIPEMELPISILTIDGRVHSMGRYPNAKANNDGYLTIQSFYNGQISGNLPQPTVNFKGGEIVIRKNNWIIDRHLITSNKGNTVFYDTTDKKNPPAIGYGYFIQNHISTLDQHGEWYYDQENKKLYMYYVGNPSEGEVKISLMNELINIHNSASNLTFNNLSIEGSNGNLINIHGSSNLTFNNCNFEYIGKNAVNSSLSKNLHVTNTTIKNSHNGGIFLGWQDQGVILQNNHFVNIYNFAGMGQNGEMQGQAIYMSETSNNVLIETNSFNKCGYNAINFNGNDIIIKNNLIDTFCFIKDDGAGIYTFTGPSNQLFVNRKVFGNIIMNGIGADKGTKKNHPLDLPYVEGIYLDENASGVEIDGNTIINVKSKGIFLNHAKNSKITNNKIINTGYSIYVANDKSIGLVENIEVINNQLFTFNDTQLHYFIRSKSDNLNLIGMFDYNVLLNPRSNANTIFVQTPSFTGKINFLAWKENYSLDNHSLNIQDKLKANPQNEVLVSQQEFPIFFDFNHTNNSKTISLFGTYIDLLGKKVMGELQIPPYSTIILLKTQNTP